MSITNRTTIILSFAILVTLIVAFIFRFSLDDNTSTKSTPTTNSRATPPVVTYIPPTFEVIASTEPYNPVGKPVPTSPLLNLDEEVFSLTDYRGKIIILNFWATWCTPCIEEMPELQAYAASAPDDVVVLAITDPNNSQTIEQVRQFLVDNNIIELPIGLDQHMAIHGELAIQQLPTTFFVDKDGVIQRRRVGQVTQEYLETTVEEIRVGDGS